MTSPQRSNCVDAGKAVSAALPPVGGASAESDHLAIILDNMANGFALFDHQSRLFVCNRRQRAILSVTEEQTPPGCTFRAFLAASPVLSKPLVEERLRLVECGTEGELYQTLADGRDVRMVIRRTPDGGFLTSCEDVTERTRAEKRIAHLAYHDPLTELPNRALLHERLEQALAGPRCAVLCLDLDGFKLVNDTLGHTIGDMLLRAVGGRLRQTVRAVETLARMGGDEFAVVISGGLAEAQTIANRLIGVVSAPYRIEDHTINVGTSIGIAVAPFHGRTSKDLLCHADMALYRAKADGRYCFRIFDPSMSAAAEARRGLEQDLRVALVEGQLELHYQSQICVDDGRITGFEALLRWRHPQRGMISPEIFIPVAEESGLIIPIGQWVLRQACHDASFWSEDIGIAVNISAVQLRTNDLVRSVGQVLEESGLSPRRLELEVTETALLSHVKNTTTTMECLRSLGVRISIDDFGTGYSSLNYLLSFPFDQIKIDRSFVLALPGQSKALAIIRAITGLARSLEIPVLAEGVETSEQLELLKAEKCSQAQGFLFSRPEPAAQVLDKLRQAGLHRCIQAVGSAGDLQQTVDSDMGLEVIGEQVECALD